jgi:hypothetical protein
MPCRCRFFLPEHRATKSHNDWTTTTGSPHDPDLREYVLRIIDERRKAPGEDLLSQLIQVHDGEDRLATEELVALVRMLILAGTDTTANLIGSMLVVCLRFDLVERVPAALDLGDDVVCGGFPDERFRVAVPMFGPGDDRGAQFGDAAERAAA